MTRSEPEPDYPLSPGLYDHLVVQGIRQALEGLEGSHLFSTADVDPEEAHTAIAQYLCEVFTDLLARYHGENATERQRRLANRMIAALVDEIESESTDQLAIAEPLQRLLAVYKTSSAIAMERPDTPLARSALLTGTRLDPGLGAQLRKEMATADRVDILCSGGLLTRMIPSKFASCSTIVSHRVPARFCRRRTNVGSQCFMSRSGDRTERG